VPLHGRRVGGWIVSVGDEGEVPADQLKPLLKYTGRGPDAAVIDLARWAQRRWASRGLRPFLVAASPARAVRTIPATTSRPARSMPPAHDSPPLALPAEGGVVRVGPQEPPDAVVHQAMPSGCAHAARR
jgi:hypothetical protein